MSRLAVERHEDFPKRSKPADIARLSSFHLPVLSERAKAVFEPHLQGLGHWIPLDFDECPYWLFHLTEVRDSLDLDCSVIRHFDDDGRAYDIKRPTFKPEALDGLFMWHVNPVPSKFVCVTDIALDLVREHKLTGFSFELLWNSKHGPLPYGLKYWERPRLTGLEKTPFDVDAFWTEYGNRKPFASEV